MWILILNINVAYAAIFFKFLIWWIPGQIIIMYLKKGIWKKYKTSKHLPKSQPPHPPSVTLADNTLIHSFIQCRFQVNSSEMQNDVDILYYIAAYYNPNNLLPTQSVQVCPQQPPLLPLPASAWPIFTQWQGSHTVRRDRRSAGRGAADCRAWAHAKRWWMA